VYNLDILSAHGEEISRVITPNKSQRDDDEDSQEEIPLTKTFKRLVTLQMVNKTMKEDPIQESFMQLLDGLRLFGNRFGIRLFCDRYVAITRNYDLDVMEALMAEFDHKDEQIHRAKIFIIASIGGRP
jgi:hypothetical protein